MPILGTKPPLGLVLPSYFVAVTASSDGSLAVLTTPASRCQLDVRRPSGATIDGGSRVANGDGQASFSYPPQGDRGESIQTVICALGDRSETAGARVVLP